MTGGAEGFARALAYLWVRGHVTLPFLCEQPFETPKPKRTAPAKPKVKRTGAPRGGGGGFGKVPKKHLR